MSVLNGISRSVARCNGPICQLHLKALFEGKIDCIISSRFYPSSSAQHCAQRFLTKSKVTKPCDFSSVIQSTFPEDFTPIKYLQLQLPFTVEQQDCIGAVSIHQSGENVVLPPPTTGPDANLKIIAQLSLQNPEGAKFHLSLRDLSKFEIDMQPGQLLLFPTDLTHSYSNIDNSVSLVAKIAMQDQVITVYN